MVPCCEISAGGQGGRACLGKGVVVAENPLEAAMAIHRAMELRVFGEAGRKIVIEECLRGVECSIHALVDGSTTLSSRSPGTISARSMETKVPIPGAWERSLHLEL